VGRANCICSLDAAVYAPPSLGCDSDCDCASSLLIPPLSGSCSDIAGLVEEARKKGNEAVGSSSTARSNQPRGMKRTSEHTNAHATSTHLEVKQMTNEEANRPISCFSGRDFEGRR
jgi:hypothetical protein